MRRPGWPSPGPAADVIAMQDILWIDFETKSRCDLSGRGVYNYMRDPSTQVLCMSWAINDNEVQTWAPGAPFPAEVKFFRGQIRAHNAAFERLVFWYILCPEYDVPEPALEQFYCTAAQARANCAPGSLEDVGRFSGASMRKDHRGAQLVRSLCMPRVDGTFREDPRLFAELVEYCEQDVRAMRAVSKSMRELSDDELADYHLNERINDRGVRVDVDLCTASIAYASAEVEDIQAIVREVTAGEITTVRSPKMRQWVFDRVGAQARELMATYKDGEKKYSIDKNARASLLILADENVEEVPPDVAEVVQCADDLWASSIAKFARLRSLADDDDHRVRGAFVFAGGSATGRASSYGAQVHNFTRKTAKDPDAVRQAMVRGHKIVPDYGKRVTDVLKGMLRPALLAADNKHLVVADWSAIEGRVNPWLAATDHGEDKLEVFRSGLDPYIVNAAATFHAVYDDVTKDQRQVGKVQELACLSEDTLILTACGEKPIQDVRPGDFVWDGVSWVRTDGAIYRGERDVIEYDGLCATPDHLVWVEGKKNPIEFGRAASNRLRLARAWSRPKTFTSFNSAAAYGGQTKMSESKIAWFCDLWCAWHSVWVPYSVSRLRLGSGEYRCTERGSGVGSNRQHKRVRTRQSALVHEGAKSASHIENRKYGGAASFSAIASRSSICRQHDEESVVGRVVIRANRGALGAPKLQTKRRVWDLLNCGPLHRFTAQGRLVHNCGFGGGVGAFAAMGRVYGLQLPEAEARRMVDNWRRVNPWAQPFWQALEDAARSAMRHKGREFTAGRITYLFDGVHLWYALPSGRVLCYPYARFDDEGNITYAKASWKPTADAKEWPRARLWRGLQCENVTQATAADILRHALRRLDALGEDVVLHVHDEIVCETDDPDRTLENMQRVMCTPPNWAGGLPLGVEAHVMRRYGKG